MWNRQSTLIMNMIMVTTLNAQARPALRPEQNWLTAHQRCLGMQADPGWITDLRTEEMEVSVTPDDALVILDRAPMQDGDGTAYLKKGLQATGGTRLTLIREVQHVDDSTLYGAYRGELSGTPVSVEQYMRERNGVVLALVIVVKRIRGSEPVVYREHTATALALLEGTGVLEDGGGGDVPFTGR